MKRQIALKSFLMALAAWLLLAGFLVLPFFAGQVKDLDDLSIIWHFKLRGPTIPSDNIRILGIDEHSINALKADFLPDSADVYKINYPPLPRDLHGLVLRRLADAGAQLVVVDVLFGSDNSWSDTEDGALRDAILYCREHGCEVVLATGLETSSLAAGANVVSGLLPAPVIMEANPLLGISNTATKLSYKLDEQVKLRADIEGYEAGRYTEAVQAFLVSYKASHKNSDFSAAEKALSAFTQGRNSFLIDYTSQYKDYGQVIQYIDLLPELPFDVKDVDAVNRWLTSQALRIKRDDGDTPLSAEDASRLSDAEHLLADERLKQVEKYKGTVVFLGSTNHLDNDYFTTPFGNMYGVETIAQAYDTLVRNVQLRKIEGWQRLAVLGVLALLAWAIALSRPLRRAAILGLTALAAVMAFNVGLFSLWQIELSMLFTLLGFLVPFACCAVYGGVGEELAKRRLRESFSKYVSQELVDKVVANPQLANIGGGVKREAAVLFCDIRNYSTISENMEPDKVVKMLNTFFGEAAEAVRRNGGSVDKYLGDGMMASFGALVPRPDSAADALRAALEMIRLLHEKVMPRLAQEGLPSFKVGVGLHYGEGIAGNIGSASRVDFTFIGDTTNVASRVEAATKEHGAAILCTRELMEAHDVAASAIPSAYVDFERVGEQQVKGRARAVELFRVFDPRKEELYKL